MQIMNSKSRFPFLLELITTRTMNNKARRTSHTLFVCLFAATLVLADGQRSSAASSSPRQSHVPRMSYIENRDIRLGIDLNLGGAITYLAPTTNQELNVINSFDWGRQVQLSYYSGPVPFNPPGTTMSTNWSFIGWNPIQTGDCYGFESQVLQHMNTGRRLYTKLIPMHWPLKNVPGECECEVWLELKGPVVQARCRLTNQRPNQTQYRARGQELPAMYVNAPFHRLMTYCSDRPFTDGGLTQINSRLEDGHWGHWLATENWAAEVNDANWGLGVWNPDAYSFSGGFAGEPGIGGPLDSPTGYIAPNRNEIIDHNIVYDYHYELILGTLEEIRAHVYRRAARLTSLTFRFKRDRQGWHYADATDAGWPVRGELEVHLDGPHPRIFSPNFFFRAEAAPRLAIEAAFSAGCSNATVLWRRLDDKDFLRTQAQSFAVVPDGQFRYYEINLGTSSAYEGGITQLRIDVLPAGNQGRVRLKSVTLGPDAPADRRKKVTQQRTR
jgi:hypothetical protein